MKPKHRGIQIALVVITSVVAASAAVTLAANPTTSLTHRLPTTGSVPFVAGSDLYFYLPIVSRNYPVDGAWLEVGAGSASGGNIVDTNGRYGNTSIAIAPDGTPFIAWHDASSGQDQIYVRRWNGDIWAEVGTGSASGGGVSDNTGYSWSPSIAVAPDGMLFVSWGDDNAGSGQIYVLRWNGVNWEEVGAGSASGGGISDTSGTSWDSSMAIASDGTPYAAWTEDVPGVSNSEIYVRRWNGSNWEEAGTGSASGGGISNTGDRSATPSIAIAPDGTPYVTWQEQYGEIYVRHWNGVSWEEVGVGSASGGGISNTAGWPSFAPAVAIAPDGTPYVTWTVYWSRESQIYVRRWNGSSWEEVGPGSASGGGITGGSFTYSVDSAIAIDPDGRPYVTWDDCGWYSDCEIYVLRWNGSTWEDVGEGSASGGGITDNDTNSRRPSIAMAPNGTPYIAWADGSDDEYEIYVRRWIGGR